ncbi:MAG TPA: transglycosylase domain-containing protein [Mycobacteriales bacterium]|nr:transglycosylase domain-containing protein [Mycobacteriales bacterium]
MTDPTGSDGPFDGLGWDDEDGVPGGPPPDRDGPDGPDGRDQAAGGRRGRRRRPRRRWIALASGTILLILVVGVCGAVYLAAKVPLPGQVVNPQTSVITYSDGRTELARVFAQNRTEVRLAQVPKPVRLAVLSAENRGFYRDPGFDLKGIARALWNNVRGKDTQGGSTITQQYVKNAYLTTERTYSRKLKELVIAIKLDRRYTKDQILEWYLNTIYFGRGAYGIEAASETYFSLPVSKLTVAQGAVLAASIRSPALYDPQNHPERARARWNFVLDGMVTEHWLSPADRAALTYPKVRTRDTGPGRQLSGPAGYIVQQVKEELARLGIDEGELNRAGLRVQTTVDKRAQDAAVAAVRQVFDGQPANLRQALVAVDPHTGGVLAYYGGSSGVGFDYAQAWRAPGSSFKPYVLATALGQSVDGTNSERTDRVTVHSRFDGTSPREFQGVLVHNAGNEQCPDCTVLEAMKRSVNTVFYDMAIQVGPDNVAALAHRMGIPARRTDNDQPTLQADGVTDGSIGIGRYEVRPIDQATGFATIASGGVLHPTHFVRKVTDSNGNVLYDASKDSPDRPTRVLDPRVANDVAFSMEPVAEWSHDALADDRPSASKTGTQQLGETPDNQDAWMVGFTPRVSAAVWVGTDHNDPLRTADGRTIFGAGLPGKTWKAFMDTWLAGSPQQDLPDRADIHGGDTGDAVDPGDGSPGPTPTGSASDGRPSPTPSPSDGTGPTPTSSDTVPVPPVPTVPLPLPSGPTGTPSEPAPSGGAGHGGPGHGGPTAPPNAARR